MKVTEGALAITKGDTKVGYNVDGVGREFVALVPLQGGNTRYLTHNEFYAMFDFLNKEEANG